MNSLTAYLAIGAVFAGFVLAYGYDKCGARQTAPIGVIAMTLAWPGYFAAAGLAWDNIPELKCEPGNVD